MKNIICPNISHDTSSARVSWALLALRLVAGIAFMLHGYSKITNPMDWMGPGAPVPGILQALAAIAEFCGGLAWILGLLTPLASLGLLVTMLVAAMFHISKGDAFVGGYELAVVYMTIALVLFCTGPGKFSADAVLKNKCKK